jgi:hypothetical protein
MFQWNVMKVEAPNDRPFEQKKRKWLDQNPCDKWGDRWMNWVLNQQQCQKTYWHFLRRY